MGAFFSTIFATTLTSMLTWIFTLVGGMIVAWLGERARQADLKKKKQTIQDAVDNTLNAQTPEDKEAAHDKAVDDIYDDR